MGQRVWAHAIAIAIGAAAITSAAAADLPVRVANLATIWTIYYAQPSRYNWMFQYYLRAAGLALSWVGTGRLIFSLNYTDSDFAEVAQRIGLSFGRAMGVVTHSYTCLDRNGQVLHEMPLQRVMSAWGVIYRPLRDQLPPECYHRGFALARVTADNDSVAAIFADGSRADR